MNEVAGEARRIFWLMLAKSDLSKADDRNLMLLHT